MDLGRLQCFIQRERRQDGGQSFREHGLAGTGWADEQGF